jgi:transcriptional regulator with XRE-family HTH domain
MNEEESRTEREVDPNAALGAAIGELRRRANVSREELAGRAELQEVEIAAIEAGRLEPTWGDLRRIAYALEVPLPELLALTERLARPD